MFCGTIKELFPVTDCIFGGSFSFPFPTSLSLSPSCDLACFSGASPSLPWCFTGKRAGSCASLPLILWCLQKIVTSPYSFPSESLTCRPLLLLLPQEFQKLFQLEQMFHANGVLRCCVRYTVDLSFRSETSAKLRRSAAVTQPSS